MEGYKKGLNFITVKEEERAKWEAAKKQEAQRLVDQFSAEAGMAKVLKLNKEDGR